MNTSVFYLFASPSGALDESPAAVFYKVKGDLLAVSLCRLFIKEYSDTNGHSTFHYKAATLISTEAQILLDEALDWLDVYDDPDPGVYDPPLPKNVLLLAQYAMRARRWEQLLVERIESGDQNIIPDKTDSSNKKSPKPDDIPQMTSEDSQNSSLVLLMLLAQAYYKMLECTISMASWCGALDLELNQSYLWTVECITNLLKNQENFKDFPMQFEPIFPDLYPSTVRDIDWEEMVAPEVERFLSTVQRYVHSRGVYDPEEGSSAWVFIELFRPGVNTAIERAIAYNKRMREYYQRIISASPHEAPSMQPTSDPKVKPDQLGTGSETKTQKRDTATQVTVKVESVSVSTEEKRFKIALSYPGERRAFVAQVASHLADIIGRDRVLYDKYYEAEFSRIDLDTYLQQLYHDHSELIAVFLCADYELKEWCGLEWRAIRDLIKRRRASAVMLFRFDQTEIPGLLSIDGYVSIETRPAKEVAELILERLALNAGNQVRD